MTLPRYPLSPLDCIGFKEVSMSTPSGMVSRTRLFTESNIALIESLRWPSSSSSAEAATPGICGGASEASSWTKAQRLLTKSSPNRCERSASGRSITRQIGGNRAVATFLEAAVSYYENGGNALRQARCSTISRRLRFRQSGRPKSGCTRVASILVERRRRGKDGIAPRHSGNFGGVMPNVVSSRAFRLKTHRRCRGGAGASGLTKSHPARLDRGAEQRSIDPQGRGN
jgi:hypothetical protein